jgi:membrane protein
MQPGIKDIGKLLKTTVKEWYRKDPFRQSAVIAYYAVFSIPGLLFLIITITGNIFGRDAVVQNILAQISGTMGADTAAQIEDMLANVGQAKSTVIGSIIGIVIILIGASGVFVELQKSLNMIWEVKVVPQKGIWPVLKARIFSFGMLLSIAFLLLISLVISTALVAMSDWIRADASDLMVIIFNVLNFVFSMAIISLLFALIYKILPDAKIKWKHVWLGAVITGVLFTIGKTALAFYFGKAQPASGYGAAGSVILILLWVSYSSMIVFLGAEFTAKYAKMYSGKVPPSKIAETAIPHKSKKKG